MLPAVLVGVSLCILPVFIFSNANPGEGRFLEAYETISFFELAMINLSLGRLFFDWPDLGIVGHTPREHQRGTQKYN